jgi:hypothetical protein
MSLTRKVLAVVALGTVLYLGCSESATDTDDPLAMSDLQGWWGISELTYEGAAHARIQVNLGSGPVQIDTTVPIDSTVTVDPDSNYLDLRPDSSFIASSTFSVESLVGNPFPRLTRSTVSAAVRDSGTWWLDGDYLARLGNSGSVVRSRVTINANALVLVTDITHAFTSDSAGFITLDLVETAQAALVP